MADERIPYSRIVKELDKDIQLNLLFNLGQFCGDNAGDCPSYVKNQPFSKQDTLQVSKEISHVVTETEWKNRVTQLAHISRIRFRPMGCSECLFNFLSLFLFFPLSCFIASMYLCRVSKWEPALRKWQDDFNHEVLEKHGMFCKTHSHLVWVIPMDQAPGESRPGSWAVTSWISFALNSNQAEILKRTSHVVGEDIRGCDQSFAHCCSRSGTRSGCIYLQ